MNRNVLFLMLPILVLSPSCVRFDTESDYAIAVAEARNDFAVGDPSDVYALYDELYMRGIKLYDTNGFRSMNGDVLLGEISLRISIAAEGFTAPRSPDSWKKNAAFHFSRGGFWDNVNDFQAEAAITDERDRLVELERPQWIANR